MHRKGETAQEKVSDANSVRKHKKRKVNPLPAPAFYSFIRNETPRVLLLENPMITGLSNPPSLSQSAILKQRVNQAI